MLFRVLFVLFISTLFSPLQAMDVEVFYRECKFSTPIPRPIRLIGTTLTTFEDLKRGSYLTNGRMKEFPYIGRTLHITFSDWSDPRDCLEISVGLHRYNLNQLGIEKENSLALIDPACLKGRAGIDLDSGTLILQLSHLAEDKILPISQKLDSVVASTYQHGVRRVFAFLNRNDESARFADLLLGMNFEFSSESQNLKDKNTTTVFTKVIEDELPVPTDAYTSKPEEENINLEEFAHQFGFFVRDEHGSPIGGIFGHTFKGEGLNGIKCAEIEAFYTSPCIRGQGFGTILFMLADDYMRGQGVMISQLGTSDFQAPELYERWGYRKVLTLPDLQKTANGRRASAYVMRKALSTPLLVEQKNNGRTLARH